MHKVHQMAANNECRDKHLGTTPLIHPTASVLNSRLGDYTEIEADCFCNEISLGSYSYLSSSVRAVWCDIGSFVSIASHCVINPGNHPYHRVTQNHCTYRRKQYGFADSDDTDFFKWRKEQKTDIGHDAWLGHGVYVMPGAAIGIGAVVAAGAVVTKKHPVEPYTIAAGVPARKIKMRFDKNIIRRLLEIRYWDWDREKLKKAFPDFNNVNRFVSKYAIS